MGLFKNLVTFGAAGRIEKKQNAYEDLQEEYQDLYEQMEDRRLQVNQVLEQVIQVKAQSVKSLQNIRKLSKNIQGKDREFMYRQVGNEIEWVNFERIQETLNAGEMALSATKGISAGVGTALGAWALASTLGTASSGTAIAGLSGAAATNATLAWFGGGSLAAGGGGMAAGTAVVGGIVAIPALALMGVFHHLKANKTINKIEQEMNKVLKSMDQIRANILQLDLIEQRSQELIAGLRKAKEVFEHELEQVVRGLNNFGIMTRWIRWIRKAVFKRGYYTESELKQIAYIGGLATNFAAIIDTPVLE